MSISLLAIDDEPQILTLYQEFLADEDLDIITTTDPAEGLQLVARKRPKIVLLDLRMPRMSGMQVLERILEIEPTTDVIMVTGDYSTESAVEAIHKGAADYIEKPVSADMLRQRVGKLVADAQKQARGSVLEGELIEAT